MTAKHITELLADHTRRHPVGVKEKRDFLNLYCDADYVCVTASGQVYEYEIKTSRSDYLRDFSKLRHRIYSGNGDRFGAAGRLPNRFWYVTATDVVRDDLPDFAGWIEVVDGGLVERVKAPLMWRGTHDVKVILQIAGAMRRRGDGV